MICFCKKIINPYNNEIFEGFNNNIPADQARLEDEAYFYAF
jgi:hypothetical protein